MRRCLLRIPFRSISDSLCNSKGPRNVADKLELSTLTTSYGHEFLLSGEESTTKSVQMQIVDALRTGERSRAFDLLLNLVYGNHSLGAADFVRILQYCSRAPDPLFVMETWRMMEEKEIGLNDTCYLLMVRALCKGGYLEEAFNLIKFLGESHRIYPILPVYNCFLGACAKMQSAVHLNLCLELMESRMVGKNEITYSELLKLAVWQQNLSAVHQIWKDYMKHYNLSILSLRKFIWSFTRLRDLKSAYETLQHMVALAMRGRLYVIRTSTGKLCSSILDIPIPLNNQLCSLKVDLEKNEHDVALNMDTGNGINEQSTIFNRGNSETWIFKRGRMSKYEKMSVMKVLRWSFSDVIHACAQTQNSGLAEQLMLQMQSLGLQPSSHTYDGFIRAIVSERGFSNGMKELKIMHQKNLKPYDSTLATLSIECSKALELDLAEALLDQISEFQYPHPFNEFLEACDTMDQPERAVMMLAKMKQLKIQPDIRTYELLFSLFGSVNAPYEEGNMLSQIDSAKRIKAIEMYMAKNSIQHSHLSMKNLLKALGAEGMIREMIQYLDMAESLFCRNNTYLGTPIYNTVLHSLVKAKEVSAPIAVIIAYSCCSMSCGFILSCPSTTNYVYLGMQSHTAIEIFKNMKSCSFTVNAATYDIMIGCCSITKCFKSASALVAMMLRDGFHPQTRTYTALIKIQLQHGDFDEALNLLDQVSSEGIQLDVLLYNTILQKACEKGRIDVIEFVVEQMRQNKVQPDQSTCYYVFYGYVVSDFHSTAVEALQVLSMRMLCEEGDTPQEKRIEFEDLILAEDSEAESRILHFFKDYDEKLAAAILQLRWCAIVGHPISWSTDKSLWTRRLSITYDTRKRTT